MDSRTDKARGHLTSESRKPLLLLVIPVYQEGENITPALQKIAAQVNHPLVVYLVYDQEDDSTLPPARKAAETLPFPVVLLKNKYGRGALNAIKTGMEYAESEFVVVTMADLSDPPAVINDMLESARKQNADIVCASRYIRGGRQTGGPWLKSFLSKMAGNALFYLASLPTHDPTNSFKLYRKTMLKQIPIESDGGFELGIELVVKAREKKFCITEVPTSWEDRQNGKSNFKFKKWLPKYLKWFLRAFCCKDALQRMLMIAAILFLCVLAAREFLAVYHYAVDVPFWDEWAIIVDLPEKFSWEWMLTPHNEHRIFFTRLTTWCFYHLNGLNMRSLILFNYGVFLLMIALYATLFKEELKKHFLLPLFLCCFFIVDFAWINLLNAFQGQFHWMLLWGIAAVYAGFKAPDSWKNTSLFALFCLFSAFSMSPVFILGLLPALLLKKIALQEKWTHCYLKACSILLVTLLFFCNYQNSIQNTSPKNYLFPFFPAFWIEFSELSIYSATGILPDLPRYSSLFSFETPQLSHQNITMFVLISLGSLAAFLLILLWNGLRTRIIFLDRSHWPVFALLLAIFSCMTAVIMVRGNSESWSARHLEFAILTLPCYAIIMNWGREAKPKFLLCKYNLYFYFFLVVIGWYGSFSYDNAFANIQKTQKWGKSELEVFVHHDNRINILSLRPFWKCNWRNTAHYWSKLNYGFLKPENNADVKTILQEIQEVDKLQKVQKRNRVQ